MAYNRVFQYLFFMCNNTVLILGCFFYIFFYCHGLEDNYYVAMYPYESNEPGDLSFVAGEMVTIIKKDGDWWTGTIGARTGVFPSNYVQKAELQYEAAADSEVEAASAAADAAAAAAVAAAAAAVAKTVTPNVKAATSQLDSKRPNTAPIDSEFEVFYDVLKCLFTL